jgi:hypothetical protein
MQKVRKLINQAEQNGFGAIAKLYWSQHEQFSVRVYERHWDFRLPVYPDEQGRYYSSFLLFAESAWVSFRSFSLSQVSGKPEADCQTFLSQIVQQLGQEECQPNSEGWWGCSTQTLEQACLFLQEMNHFLEVENP